jgi:hypothetical protein
MPGFHTRVFFVTPFLSNSFTFTGPCCCPALS